MNKYNFFPYQDINPGGIVNVNEKFLRTIEILSYQNILICLLKSIALIQVQQENDSDQDTNEFIIDGLYMTLSNTNFDKDRFTEKIFEAIELRDRLINQYTGNINDFQFEPLFWKFEDVSDIENKATSIDKLSPIKNENYDLQELLINGLKGMAAYIQQARNLNFEDIDLYNYINHTLVFTVKNNPTDDIIKKILETGKYGIKAMKLLDTANTTAYGNPEASKVNIGVGKNPGILVSGHDLRDLYEILEETEGQGIDIYTHCELLPAHYYPVFKKYKHFVGNYGNGWWNQRDEFKHFHGPILFTTNCIIPPDPNAEYADKVFTTGSAGYKGFKHVEGKNGEKKNFTPLINIAKKSKSPDSIEIGSIQGGFAHHQLIEQSAKIIRLIKEKKIRKFIAVLGCDGRFLDRTIYAKFIRKIPNDVIILTSGCAKYRYIKLPLGNIEGIPRVMDIGQCNDSYSLIAFIKKLKDSLNCDNVNSLPVSYRVAWYEQKAVILLFALLYLGIKNIYVDPMLPAYVSKDIVEILEHHFGINGAYHMDKDLAMFYQNDNTLNLIN